MNNKGFTLVEVLTTLVIISLLVIVASNIVNSSLATNKEEAYELMKKNIITVSQNYINECNAKTINCDFSYINNNTFYAEKLREYGYFKNLQSPIDGKYLGDCILIKAIYDNGSTIIDIEDTCY